MVHDERVAAAHGAGQRGWLLAVHAGAGRFSAASDAAHREVMREALRVGQSRLLSAGIDAASAADRPTVAATVAAAMLGVFERSERSNCGLGSNLNERGHVECEASVVCGRSRLLGACAGVRGVEEPSSLALSLLAQAEGSARVPPFTGRGLGRQPPLVVVGGHALELARQFGLRTASEAEMDRYQVTDASAAHWAKWDTRFKLSEREERGRDAREESDADEPLDTVGAVVVDPLGNVAAALSSGGVAYKTPGRVGLAGCPRIGCTAANARESRRRGCGTSERDDATFETRAASSERRERKRRREVSQACEESPAVSTNAFAVACSGRGEHFIRSELVGTLSRRLAKATSLEKALRKSFEDARADNGGEAVEGGVLAVVVPRPRSQELGVAFSTPCMAVGFQHSAEPGVPHVEILRQPESARQALEQLALHVSLLSL